MWQDTSYEGPLLGEFAYNMDFAAVLSSSNDDTTSIANNGYCGNLSIAYFYKDERYSGDSRRLFCPGIGKQSRDPWLGNGTDADGGAFNDVITSASFGN